MSLRLLLVIGFALLFGHMLPIEVKQFCYTLSLVIKESLLFVLPVIIFSLLFSSLIKMSRKAVSLVLWLLPIICLSNFFTTFYSMLVGIVAIKDTSVTAVLTLPNNYEQLQALWSFSLPKLIANDKAMFTGLLLGLLLPMIKNKSFIKSINKMAEIFNSLATSFLHKLFIPIVPIFILGFILKIQHEGVLLELIKNYASIFFIILISQILYLFVLYGISTQFKVSVMFRSIKNMLPAAMSGFSTMSSAATLPISLDGAEKNTKAHSFSSFVMPLTVNIHLIGDCIAIPVLALAILSSYGFGFPDVYSYAIFAAYFALAKFAVAAVPGGGVLVMLPILEAHLGFSTDMLSLITTLYILFDCVITAINVMGNGAFVMFLHNIFGRSKLGR